MSSYSHISMTGGTAHYGHVYGNIVVSGHAREEESTRRAPQALGTLFLVNPQSDRDILINKKGKRAPGTFEWIKEDSKFQAWLRRDQQLLWIRGGPGKGKTVLSIFLTEELEKDRDLVYFFCTAQDQKRDNAAAIVRGLLWQLLNNRPYLAGILVDHFDMANVSQATTLSREAVWAVFVDTVCHDRAPRPITCVLDGLDECDADSRSWLIEKLSGPMSHKRSGVRHHLQSAIVSRDIHELRRVAEVSVDLDRPETNRADIKRLVSTRLSEMSLSLGFDDRFRHAIEKKILERASDTFLWVGYAMMELSKKTTCTEVERTLQDLPQGLEAIYSRMLRQIKPDHRKISAQILRWVVLAVRPLSLVMLATAIGTKSTELLSVQQVLRDQIKHCSPFVVIQHEDDTARLVHQSARDYLLNGKVNGDERLQEFHFSPEEVHLELASICLESLKELHRLTKRLEESQRWVVAVWKAEKLRRSAQAQRLEQAQQSRQDHELCEGTRPAQEQQTEAIVYPLGFQAVLDSGWAREKAEFWRYAIAHWPAHARYTNSRAAELLEKHLQFFNSQSELRRKWFQAYDSANFQQYSTASWPALHIACYLGIEEWVRKILLTDGKQCANEKGRWGNTALHWAAAKGHRGIVELLLDSEGDVRAENKTKKTALHVAAQHGRTSVVPLLLKAQAVVGATDTESRTALHYAAKFGHEIVVRQLIERDRTCLDKVDMFGWSALHLAARNNCQAAVAMLLNRGANVHVLDHWRTTAAFYAEDPKIRRELKIHGADVGMVSWRFGLKTYALSHDRLVQLLEEGPIV